jgi:hypothetical protein
VTERGGGGRKGGEGDDRKGDLTDNHYCIGATRRRNALKVPINEWQQVAKTHKGLRDSHTRSSGSVFGLNTKENR